MPLTVGDGTQGVFQLCSKRLPNACPFGGPSQIHGHSAYSVHHCIEHFWRCF